MKETLLTKLQREAREKADNWYTEHDGASVPYTIYEFHSVTLEEVIANTLKQVSEEVRNMQQPMMVMERALTNGGGYPDFKALGYNQALTDVQRLLGEDKN
jgi:hypothetical protein